LPGHASLRLATPWLPRLAKLHPDCRAVPWLPGHTPPGLDCRAGWADRQCRCGRVVMPTRWRPSTGLPQGGGRRGPATQVVAGETAAMGPDVPGGYPGHGGGGGLAAQGVRRRRGAGSCRIGQVVSGLPWGSFPGAPKQPLTWEKVAKVAKVATFSDSVEDLARAGAGAAHPLIVTVSDHREGDQTFRYIRALNWTPVGRSAGSRTVSSAARKQATFATFVTFSQLSDPFFSPEKLP
jgi:hypothetical protein